MRRDEEGPTKRGGTDEAFEAYYPCSLVVPYYTRLHAEHFQSPTNLQIFPSDKNFSRWRADSIDRIKVERAISLSTRDKAIFYSYSYGPADDIRKNFAR